jgi:hypothetical protein
MEDTSEKIIPVKRVVLGGETKKQKVEKLMRDMNKEIMNRIFQYWEEKQDLERVLPVPFDYLMEMEAFGNRPPRDRRVFLGFFLSIYAETLGRFKYNSKEVSITQRGRDVINGKAQLRE